MADIHYFVSAQHGNDGNTGLSEEQAWATLTKAVQSIPTPAVGNCHICHCGPGTYREKLAFLNGVSGRSATEYIQYAPDPDCLWLTSDVPGRCRITGCGTDEVATAGDLLGFSSRQFIVFGSYEADWWLDGVTGNAVRPNASSYQVRQIRINARAGQNAFYACRAPECCTAAGGTSGFQTCVSPVNCIALGGQYAFYNCQNPVNCTSQGGTVYMCPTPINCLTVDNLYGFWVNPCSMNCIAQGCYYGFYSAGNVISVYDCQAGGCLWDFGSSPSYFGGDASVTKTSIIAGRIGQMPHMATGVRGLGTRSIIDTFNTTVTGAAISLSSPRLIAFTPNQEGISKGVAVYVSAPAATGTVLCELQKNIGGTWQTQRSRSLPGNAYTASSWGRFLWDTGDGDDHITPIADTWRYRVSATDGAPTVRTSNGSNLSYIGLYEPTGEHPMDWDIDGRPRPNPPSVGAWEPPDMEPDWDTYHTAAPGIRLRGHSMHLMQVPAKGGQTVTVSWQVLHHSTGAAKLPQVWLRRPGSHSSLQTVTHTGAEDSWQELSVTATPPKDTVLEVCLFSRDTAADSYSVFSDPSVAITEA